MAAQSQTAIPDPNTSIPLSDTVKTTLAAFPDGTPVSAWMLVRGALTFHDDYGNYLAKRLVSESGPSGGTVKPATAWLDEVVALFNPAKTNEIHGRLFILGLAELDAELARFLDNFGFRDALKKEIQEPFELLLKKNTSKTQTEANYPNESVANPSIPPSDSVRTVIQRFADRRIVDSWTLVFNVLTFHTDYGANQATELLEKTGGPSGYILARSSTRWLEDVTALFDPSRVHQIQGRLFILGLAELDSDLAQFLDSFGFRDALKREIQEPYNSLLRRTAQANINLDETTLNASGTVSSPSSSNYIIFRADAATDADQLGRAGFADALATWLNRIWGENYTSYINLRTILTAERQLPDGNSFIVHLHGPWGSGKTSLLRLMEKALKEISFTIIGGVPQTWQVIWFNAWRNRHLDPVWWPLMNRVFQETVNNTQVPIETKLWESWWRARIVGLGQYIIAIGMAILTILGLWLWTRSSGGTLGQLISGLSTILTFAITVGSGVLALSRSLASGSSNSAQNFLRLTQDPMERIRLHFSEVLDKVNAPVMIFIDDLDRCQPEYVVRLLESLQTLFNDPRVFYVIAADRRWLYECFEIVYKDFKATVREPGRRTGYLFLEKIFQMSISVPAMSEETQKAYLDTLYRGERHEAEQKIAVAQQQAHADFAQVTTTEALIEQLQKPQSDPDPLVQQARREVAVRRLASQEVSADIEHFLQPFAPLLERNPRAMKRLVNAYSVYLALAMLADVQLINSDEKKKRFALWTILSLRWPALAEKLEKDPEILPAFLEKEAVGLDPELTALVQDEDVQRVLHGEAKNVGVALDSDTILRLWGLQANTSNPVVA